MRLRVVMETAATIAVAVVWFVALRPVALGGPASYIVVHGYSMGGTLAPGDLVVAMSHSSYSVGDAIVYRVPAGSGKGLLVVHRIVGADPTGYRVQGDANSYQDPWQPKASDVVGRLVLTLPGVGSDLASLANPFVLGISWALAALMVGLSLVPDSPGSTRRVVLNPRLPQARRPTRLAALEVTTGLGVTFMVGLAAVTAVVVVNSAWTLLVAVLSAIVALFVGLFFLPASSMARHRVLQRRRVRRQRRIDHPALDVAAALAVSVMVGLVTLSSEASISAANATSLTLGSPLISARVTQCPSGHPLTGTCT